MAKYYGKITRWRWTGQMRTRNVLIDSKLELWGNYSWTWTPWKFTDMGGRDSVWDDVKEWHDGGIFSWFWERTSVCGHRFRVKTGLALTCLWTLVLILFFPIYPKLLFLGLAGFADLFEVEVCEVSVGMNHFKLHLNFPIYTDQPLGDQHLINRSLLSK